MLLPRDVPHAKRLPYPNKEIGLRALLQIADDSAAARKADTALMTKAGFRRSAIAGYAGPGRRYWESGAIELGSPAQARDVLAAESTSVLSEAPKGITTTVAADHAFANASVVTFTPPAGNARALGGYEIFVASGRYFYYLVSLDKPGKVSRHDLETKLRRIMRRI